MGLLPEIPGVVAPPQLALQFRREIAQLLNRDSINFPGSQPVSFAHKHLEALRKEDYYVCEKSDGLRSMLYFTRGDQDSEIHYLGLHFPQKDDSTFQSYHIDTLVDGELVLDDLGNGRTLLRYLVFDCLVLDGKHLMHRTLDKRLAYFKELVYEPYRILCKTFPEEVKYFPFVIEFKPMQLSYGIELMFKEIIPKLKHGNDGLIFTARNSPYKFGTDDKILKWKTADENSIDFQLTLEFPIMEPLSDDEEDEGEEEEDEPTLDYNAKPRFVLSTKVSNNQYEPWANMYMEDEEWEHMKSMNVELQEKIVECAMDEQKRWRFKRFRNDKKDGNHISTVKSVMESIKDAIGEEDLLAAAGSIRTAWKAREAVQKEQARRAYEAEKARRGGPVA